MTRPGDIDARRKIAELDPQVQDLINQSTASIDGFAAVAYEWGVLPLSGQEDRRY